MREPCREPGSLLENILSLSYHVTLWTFIQTYPPESQGPGDRCGHRGQRSSVRGSASIYRRCYCDWNLPPSPSSTFFTIINFQNEDPFLFAEKRKPQNRVLLPVLAVPTIHQAVSGFRWVTTSHHLVTGSRGLLFVFLSLWVTISVQFSSVTLYY